MTDEFKSITIEITDVNKPPTIKLDGVKVPLVEFEHSYDTSTSYSKGTHRYLLKYVEGDKVKVLGYERPDGNEQPDGYTAPFTVIDETVEDLPTRLEGSD